MKNTYTELIEIIKEYTSEEDEEDGDITDKILVEGSVDTSKVGVYKLTYSVTDSQVKVIRTVTVVKNIDDYENPKTYDFGIGGYIALAVASGCGLYISKRKKNK